MYILNILWNFILIRLLHEQILNFTEKLCQKKSSNKIKSNDIIEEDDSDDFLNEFPQDQRYIEDNKNVQNSSNSDEIKPSTPPSPTLDFNEYFPNVRYKSKENIISESGDNISFGEKNSAVAVVDNRKKKLLSNSSSAGSILSC